MNTNSCLAEHYLAASLERLMALPLNGEEDIARWVSESDKIEQTLAEQFPTFKPLDIFMFFMHDPDIRAHDNNYRDDQHRLISDYIGQLRGHSRDI